MRGKGSERGNDLPKVTQLEEGAGIAIQSFLTHKFTHLISKVHVTE